MDTETNESDFAARIKLAIEPANGVEARDLKHSFTTRLKQVAAQPDVVPVEFDGKKIGVRRGGTLLGGALKNDMRLMHVCGARTLCGTCRVVVESGEDNLTPMRAGEKFSLRWHLSVSPRTRLACQARVDGPVEVTSVFPLCGDLPGGSE